MRIHLPGIGHPVVEKYFRVLEVHRGMNHIQDLNCEEKARFGFILYFLKFWVENPVSVYVKKTEL